ncbi:hypothetical protein V5O48_004602 [Marasmius crinis-equi]|uniref:Uncharacterized protein n=1 Tax=Marasmius crinis-equi TaxID=585013 RepID=A0ABR3FPK7_9AGAR
MNPNYKTEAARMALDDLIKERRDASTNTHNIATFIDESDSDPITMLCGMPEAWRFIQNQDDPEEVVFNVQGIVTNIDLPPFNTPISRQVEQKPPQSSGEFDIAMQKLKVANSYLTRNIKEGTEVELNCVDLAANGHPSLTLTNRYFTSKRLAPNETSIPFPPDVDPYRHLESLSGPEYIHTADNHVEYWQYQPILPDDTRFVKTAPSVFRIGDIVEAQFTLTLAEIRSGKPPYKYKAIATLRTVTLFNKKYTDDAKHAMITQVNEVKTLKRKIGMQDEMHRDAEKKMREMSV